MRLKKITAGLCALVLTASGAVGGHAARNTLLPGASVAAAAYDELGGNSEPGESLVGKCGKNLKWEFYNGTLTISGSGEMDNYDEYGTPWQAQKSSIKKLVVQSGVGSIGDEAFRNCTALSEVEIANGIVSIGYDAFRNCRALTAVRLPGTLTAIANGAFSGCTALTEIAIPDSVTSLSSYPEHDYPGAFEGCTSLRFVTLSDSLRDTGHYVFRECSALRYINIPDGVKTIGYNAFQNCTSLADIYLPGGLENIYSSSFQGCASMKYLDVPKSVSFIGISAFEDTPWYEGLKAKDPLVIVNNILIDGQSAKGKVVIPNGTRIICENAFWGNQDVTAIEIPSSVIKIGSYAFCDCGIKELTVPSSVMNVGNCAFAYCSELENISIQNNIETLGSKVFYCNSKLKSITLPENITESFLEDSWIGWTNTPEETFDEPGEGESFEDVTTGGEETKTEEPAKTAGEGEEFDDPGFSFDFSEVDDEIEDSFIDFDTAEDDEDDVADGSLAVNKDRMLKGITVFGYYETDSEKFARRNQYVFRDRNTSYGDLDNSGDAPGIADLVLMQKASAGWKVKYNRNAADVDGNGVLDINDVIYMQKMVAGWKV